MTQFPITRIADTYDVAPGTYAGVIGAVSGGFAFNPSDVPSISDGEVVFASGVNGYSGYIIWTAPASGGDLTDVINATTPIPGGIGDFSQFNGNLEEIDNGTVVVAGVNANGQVSGLYAVPASGGTVSALATTATVPSGSSSTLANFSADFFANDGEVVFTSSQRVYAVSETGGPVTLVPQIAGMNIFDSAEVSDGVAVLRAGNVSGRALVEETPVTGSSSAALAIATGSTPTPGVSGDVFDNFTLKQPEIDNGDVVFEGASGPVSNPIADTVFGIYADVDGSLIKLVDSNTPVPGGVGDFENPYQGFTSLDSYSISDGLVVFLGRDANNDVGLYAVPVTGGPITRLIGEGDPIGNPARDLTVGNLLISRNALSSGQLAFQAVYPNSAGYGVYVMSGLSALVPCFAAGTLIRSPAGDVAVERLQAGDVVTLASGGAATVRWVGHRRIDCARHERPSDVWPVRVAAASFAPGQPARDLWLSPDHAVFVDGVLIPVKCLINGATIVQEPRAEVTYWHVELDRHDVILAEGLPAESFVDDDSRILFHNADDYAERYPGAARIEAVYCAPRVTAGYALEAVRQRLGERAGVRQPVPLAPLRGFVDRVGETVIDGWAQNPQIPEAPVCVDVVLDGKVLTQTLANQPRNDLKAAGLGSGRHAFSVRLPRHLTLSEQRKVQVRRSSDLAVLARSQPERVTAPA